MEVLSPMHKARGSLANMVFLSVFCTAAACNGGDGADGAAGEKGADGTPGAPGAVGQPGATGDAGAAGPQAPGMRWIDGTGASVRVVGVPGPSLLLVADAAGVVWSYIAETETARAAQYVFQVFYTTADCTGPKYVRPMTPKVAFEIAEDATIRYRTPTQASAEIQIGSSFATGICSPSTQTIRVLAVDALTAAGAPPTFVPPLRPDL